MDHCDDEHIDRISNLPMNVIDSILQRLHITELVKTSVLSRKWRYIWASAPRLLFEHNFFEKCKHLGYFETYATITEILLLHTGPVHEFSISPPPNYPIKLECLNKWILFLSRKRVQDIGLSNEQKNPYPTPTHIFSCRDLTYLFLQNFRFSVPPSFSRFQSLVELHLCYIIFESGALESLMSSCPLLAYLHLSYCSGFEHIYGSFLHFLQIEGDEVIKSICLKEPQYLTLLELFADAPQYNIEGAWLYDLLKNSPNIWRLSLGTSYIKLLSAGINPQTQLKAVKYLKLDGVDFNKARELLFTIFLLESSSNLEELVIKCNNKGVELQQIPKEFEYSNCCFKQLQEVNITVNTSFKPALDLMRFVLARSPALKILTFRIDLGLNQSYASTLLLSISCDLLQMVRASPRAQVKFLYEEAKSLCDEDDDDETLSI